MPSRRQFIKTTTTAAAAAATSSISLQAEPSPGIDSIATSDKKAPSREATFILVADTHYSSVDENHPASLAMVRAINQIANVKTQWPKKLNGNPTGFSCAGKPVSTPRGIIHLGDMTDFGSKRELHGGKGFLGLKSYKGFRQFWEHDSPAKTKVTYPVYCGLGNHDLDFSQTNRKRMWRYVATRHHGKKAPVPAHDFHADSLCYAIQWGPLRILQLQRFASDTAYKRKTGIHWLKKQLTAATAARQHVLLCQHYGFDPFGLKKRWWTDTDRQHLLDTIKPHSNIIGLCHGHSHATGLYQYRKLQIFRCNNMGWEIKYGNKDGKGSFALVHITPDQFDLVHVECTSAKGDFQFRPQHYFSSPLTNPTQP